MPEKRKLAAILAADVVGYSKLAGSDEERTLARLRALRSDLIDPTIAVHHGRVVKRTGDGSISEFRSVVDAVRCAIEVQNGMVERNAGLPPERRIEFRVGIHLGDVVEESDGDLMGDGVNIAARLQGIAEPGGICLSEDAYRQVRGKTDVAVQDLGDRRLKNISEPVRAYAMQCATAATSAWKGADTPVPRLSIVVLPFANLGGDEEQDYFVDGVTESLTTDLSRMAGASAPPALAWRQAWRSHAGFCGDHQGRRRGLSDQHPSGPRGRRNRPCARQSAGRTRTCRVFPTNPLSPASPRCARLTFGASGRTGRPILPIHRATRNTQTGPVRKVKGGSHP